MHDLAHVDDTALVHVLHELGHVSIGRLSEDLLRGSDLDDDAVSQDADPGPHPQCLVEVVGDEEDRLVDLVLDGHELVLHLTPDERVQGAERLVHEEDVRVGAECPCQAHALLHAAGELPGGVEGIGLQAHHGKRLDGCSLTFRLVDALDLQAIGGVVDDVAVGEEGEVLEHHGQLLPPE